MRRVELAALRSNAWTWEGIGEALAPALEPLGLLPGSSANGVEVDILDRGAQGRVLIFDHAGMARRAALALAVKTQAQVEIFEVIATHGGARYRFRTEAWVANAAGELRGAEGVELNLEDPEGWTGDLDEQAHQVLDAFAGFDFGAAQRESRSFKKRKLEKASTPRVAALLSSLQKSKSHEAVPQPEGRVELRIELAAGGKQRSFCTTAEYDELRRLIGA